MTTALPPHPGVTVLAAPTDLIVERVRRLAARAAGDGGADALPALETLMAGQAGAALRRLSELFQLSPVERDLLEVCVAMAIEPSLGELFAGLTGRPYATDGLVARLHGHRRGRAWNPGGALGVWKLVHAEPGGVGDADALVVDPVVPAWLAGELWIDRALVGIVHAPAHRVCLSSWPIEPLATAARQAVRDGRPIRFVLRGDPGSGRTALATAVAAAAALPALLVDTSDVADAEWPDVHVRLQRLAAVGGLALIWTGPQAARPWPTAVSPAPVHFLACEPGALVRPLAAACTEVVDVAEPTIAERRWLWTATVPAARGWSRADIDALTTKYRLGVGDMLAVAADGPSTPAQAARAARACRRIVDDDVVRVMPCPFAWDDLVLPPTLRAALEDLAFEAAECEALREHPETERLFSSELSQVALFAGPSGTGKTMCAQVLAAHLEKDLLRVDTAGILSKWLGDTAKNLNRIFALAKSRQALLLFDEADAHFSARTEIKDSRDKYSNADTSHLLQLIQTYRSGIVILATNRRSDIDPAFVRRLRHVLEFPRPLPADRLAMCRRMCEAAAPGTWESLASRAGPLVEALDVTGAQIKSAVLSSLFFARRDGGAVRFEHLLRGFDRELAKDGRPLSPRDRQHWMSRG